MIRAQVEGQPYIDWGWIADHMDDVWTRLVEHFYLTFLAVAIGMLISFPLAIFAHRHRRSYGPIAAVTGLLYTIPSLALFAFLVPYTRLSVLTAEIGLVSYTLLILIRGVVSGLSGVPSDAREAALGMGYSRSELLWRVELPLSTPVIIAGIRIATVTTIGLVTVTALIGKGGLGFFILMGIDRNFPTAALLGSVLSLALAVLVDFFLVRVERLATPWARRERGVTI
ncbi:MAG: ABC transporter permease [Actinomycetota bacterium]|nr:ABC transporter permease [Actinomycetota bacterium]